MTQGKTATVFADEVSESRCTGRSCGAAVTWAKFVKSGKKCPFDELVILRSGTDQATGRPTHVIDLERSHYATCPDADRFRTKKPAAGARAGGASVSKGQIEIAKAEINHAIDAMKGLFQHPPTELDVALRQAGLACNKALHALGAPIRRA